MSEPIPDEVMREARAIAHDTYKSSVTCLAEAIARALMARDKRAAERCRQQGEKVPPTTKAFRAYRDGCNHSATAIETYGA